MIERIMTFYDNITGKNNMKKSANIVDAPKTNSINNSPSKKYHQFWKMPIEEDEILELDHIPQYPSNELYKKTILQRIRDENPMKKAYDAILKYKENKKILKEKGIYVPTIKQKIKNSIDRTLNSQKHMIRIHDEPENLSNTHEMNWNYFQERYFPEINKKYSKDEYANALSENNGYVNKHVSIQKNISIEEIIEMNNSGKRIYKKKGLDISQKRYLAKNIDESRYEGKTVRMNMEYFYNTQDRKNIQDTIIDNYLKHTTKELQSIMKEGHNIDISYSTMIKILDEHYGKGVIRKKTKAQRTMSEEKIREEKQKNSTLENEIAS